MDRSTRATLSTYNTWIHSNRLQAIYYNQCFKLKISHHAFNSSCDTPHTGTLFYVLPCRIGNNVKHFLASIDSDLEAFNRNPTDGSFATLAFQLTTFTKYLNEVFLSY